jgi:PleD family two-component response regulator
MGVAEYVVGETMQELLDRADRGMYREKSVSRAAAGSAALPAD